MQKMSFNMIDHFRL